MPTIKDVAKKAGVSISTASYALNNQSNVHPETKRKILAIAKELNYYPNASARNLKTKRTGNVGVFVYGFGGPVFSDVLEGIRQALQANDLNIIVSSGKASSTLLKERQIDGAIVFDGQLSDDTLLHYASFGHPLFVLDRILEGPNIYPSLIDNEGLVYRFIREMLEKGYRDFGYLSGPTIAFNNNHRYDGFKQALSEVGLPHTYIQGDFTIQSGYQAGIQLVHSKQIPRFIFCANDESAIGLIQALKENQIAIPDDVAVAGFDNIVLGSYVSPKLSTIGIDHIEWGKQVANALVDLLNDKTPDLQIPIGKIILRDST
ncbi:LacI family transcriptional regulator [Acholeplasma vituli]|uniref:LacI family transcriptional regulator n=1 Tax=Paracholeplasma vituli TaxID=69473 RepID=A0ABT2PXR0_9MOLU|nr:LacI family DNA-binding transcriptional regulator [Paracholeplasma vituli]MCU0105513.1 LacI family transcriptional regulator [Paracholeplasma vituli]